MTWQRGDVVKETWRNGNETTYLVILKVLSRTVHGLDRYYIYDMRDGQTSDAGLKDGKDVTYTLKYRPNDKL